jgi:hypothetical protein
MVEFDSKMWILGGSRPDTGEAFDIAMWSTDGTTWTQDNAMGAVRNAGFAQTYGRKIVIGAGQANDIGTDPQPVLKDVMFTDYAVPTATATITKTPYYTRTNTPSRTQTNTVSPTKTITPSRTMTATKTITQTPTGIVTFTDTPTITETDTVTPTSTPTDTITETWTVSETHTVSPTSTITLTATPIETVIIWYSSTDTDWHKTDLRLSWRQYPDSTENPVSYTLYYSAINRATDYPHVIPVPNEDDISPDNYTFTYDLQGVPFEDIISLTLTAVGGDLGVSFMSNNIAIGPKASPTP